MKAPELTIKPYNPSETLVEIGSTFSDALGKMLMD